MKLIAAVIKPFNLDEIRVALTKAGVHGLTGTEIESYGRQKGHTEIYRGAEYSAILPKLRGRGFEQSGGKGHDAVVGSAKTGEIGDGKIFVLGLEHPVRIRAGETGVVAI